MATVQNLSFPGTIDRPYTTPNRRGAALPVPLYAGEIFLNTASGLAFVAVPPTGLPIGSWAATDWVQFSYGLGLN
jgi:hypothetical protein